MLFFKMSSIAVVLVEAAEQTSSTDGSSIFIYLFSVWTILPPKRLVWRTVVSKMEMLLADHFSFDKSQIAAHDSLFTGMEVEQHIQNSPCRRRLALWDCFWGHCVDLDGSIRFWVASWDLQNWRNVDFQSKARGRGRGRFPVSGIACVSTVTADTRSIF